MVMDIAFKIIALQLSWASCLGIYLSSPQQPLIDQPLPAKVTGLLFIVTATLAFSLLSLNHHSLMAFIILLGIWMMNLIILTLLPPHSPNLKRVFIVGSAIALLVSILGGAHVV